MSWLLDWDAIWSDRHLETWVAAFAAGSGTHATPFMHPDFVRSWLQTAGGQDRYRPFFLIAEHSSGQRVLWLFVQPPEQWKGGYVRTLVPIGSRMFPSRTQLSAYMEPVITPFSAGPSMIADGFWEALRAELDRRAGSWFDVCSIGRFRARCLGSPDGATPYNVAPYLRLDGHDGIGSYMATRKPRLRSGIRRRLRRMDEAGEAVFEVHDPADVDGILAWLPDFEAARMRRLGAPPLPEGCLRNLVTNGSRSGLVHCSTLRLDGRAISWKIGYFQEGIYYGYFRAFDEGFAELSPGVVHFYRLLEWILANDGRLVDFGIGAQDYKYEWTDGEEWSLLGLTIRSRAPASLARRSAASLLRMARRQAGRAAGRASAPAPAIANAAGKL